MIDIVYRNCGQRRRSSFFDDLALAYESEGYFPSGKDDMSFRKPISDVAETSATPKEYEQHIMTADSRRGKI